MITLSAKIAASLMLVLTVCLSACSSPNSSGPLSTGPAGYDYDLYMLNADSSSSINLTADFAESIGDAFWPPDGSRILFRYGKKCAVIDADGSNLVELDWPWGILVPAG